MGLERLPRDALCESAKGRRLCSHRLCQRARQQGRMMRAVAEHDTYREPEVARPRLLLLRVESLHWTTAPSVVQAAAKRCHVWSQASRNECKGGVGLMRRPHALQCTALQRDEPAAQPPARQHASRSAQQRVFPRHTTRRRDTVGPAAEWALNRGRSAARIAAKSQRSLALATRRVALVYGRMSLYGCCQLSGDQQALPGNTRPMAGARL